MNYLLVCEIGPIVDFVTKSRKTVDYWAGSFLFSYSMAEVAHAVEKKGGILFRPTLDKNPLYTGKGKVLAGSVPDQLCFKVSEKDRIGVCEELKKILPGLIKNLYGQIGLIRKELPGYMHMPKGPISNDEAENYFRLFYILEPLAGIEPTYEEYTEAMRKIAVRGEINCFAQLGSDAGVRKWEKCDLCGERIKIAEVDIDKLGGQYDQERLCSLCLLKRLLKQVIPPLVTNLVQPQYDSTSDLALVPVRQLIREDGEKSGEFSKIVKDIQNSIGTKDISEGRFFYDSTHRKSFEKWREEIEKSFPDSEELNWIDRPFYCIVKMDGDNLRSALQKKQKDFTGFQKLVSDVLGEFSNNVGAIVSKHHGQLIFAGGEDVSFMIHPQYLLPCIHEINLYYRSLFCTAEATRALLNKFTLSSGAVVCPHKYPLSKAIREADETLDGMAKRHPGKNATAILLIKGHQESARFDISNNHLEKIIRLKEGFFSKQIPSVLPYKIRDESILFEVMTDPRDRENLIRIILGKTRDRGKDETATNSLAASLIEICECNLERMVGALLFARFLAIKEG